MEAEVIYCSLDQFDMEGKEERRWEMEICLRVDYFLSAQRPLVTSLVRTILMSPPPLPGLPKENVVEGRASLILS